VRRRLEDPMAVLGAAMVMAVVAVLPLGPVRAVVNLPLLLLLPGHALLVALRSPDAGLELAGRVAARVAASLALVGVSLLAVGSVVDLSRTVVVLTIWAVVVALGLVAVARPRPDPVAAGPTVWTQSGVLLGLAAGLTTVLVVAGVAVLPEPRQEPYSRLSVSGETRDAGTPLLVTGRTAVVHVEVENGDDEAHRFGVVAAVDGGAQWESVARRIGPGETWTGAVEGRVPADACLSRLRISLTRDGEPSDVNPLILYLRDERGDACT
jgi:hypothetical protein